MEFTFINSKECCYNYLLKSGNFMKTALSMLSLIGAYNWRNAKSRHQVFFNHLLRVCEAEAHANISLIIIIIICKLRFMSQSIGGVIRQ